MTAFVIVVCRSRRREVPSERVANGYEVSSGRWVVITDDELGAADPARTHAIDVEIKVEDAPEPPAVLDLMAALEESVAAAKAGRKRKAKAARKRKSALGRLPLR